MTEPQSTKTEPYCEFPKQAYSILTDDFCHEKFLVLKPTIRSNQSIIKLKETVNHKNKQYHLSDELKVWFNLPRNGTLYAKFKGNDYIKVHYDDGVRVINGKKFYFYSALNTNKNLNLHSVKLGVGHDSEHCHSDNRLKIISHDSSPYQYKWYNRTMVYHNKVRFGLLACFDICNKVLQKNGLLLGYDIDTDTQVFFRAEHNGFRKDNSDLHKPQNIFERLTFDAVRVLNRGLTKTTTAGLQVGFDLKKKSLSHAQAVIQLTKVNKELVKVRVNHLLNVALLVKKPLNWFDNSATFSAGVQISGLLKNHFGVRNGFQLAINL